MRANFLYKGIAVLALVTFIDFAVGLASKKMLTNLPDKDSMLSTIYYSLFKIEGDVIIVGPSTAHHHLNTKIIEDSLKMSAYNAALDGRDIVYTDVILQSIISRHVPRIIIMDIGAIQMNGKWRNRIHDVKPYYGINYSVTSYYNNEEDWQQRLKLLSALYRNNKTLSYLIRVQIDVPNLYKGYSPTYGKLENINRIISDDFRPDPVELSHLINIIELCKDNKIELVLIQSPQVVGNAAFDSWIDNFSRQNGLKLYSENRNNYWYKHPELFRDEVHLNASGGDELTRIICHKLLGHR